MQVINDISYTQLGHPKQKLDVYLPDAEEFPVFIYFHGGGLIVGDKRDDYPKDRAAFYGYLQKHGIAAIGVNYRLYPEAKHPDHICDAAAAVAWAKKNMPQYGKVKGIYVGGSSGGAYLTAMLCFDKKYLGIHGIDADSLAGYICDSAQLTTHFNILKERGMDEKRTVVDEDSPLYHVQAGRNYPPMWFIIGDKDMPNRYEYTQLMLSTMKRFGYTENVEYSYMTNCTHCLYLGTYDEEGNNDFAKMVEGFIGRHIDKYQVEEK